MNYYNYYYILRHGNSIANQEGLIVSDYDIGTCGYGLSKKGEEQILRSIGKLSERNYIIISSPFFRTKESAQIVAKVLDINNILYHDGLRERFFGKFDMSCSNNYTKVWSEDLKDPTHEKWNVESVVDVLKRASDVVLELERKYKNRHIILVSHGDIGQILECGFRDISPEFHRSIVPLEQGEFRVLNDRPMK